MKPSHLILWISVPNSFCSVNSVQAFSAHCDKVVMHSSFKTLPNNKSLTRSMSSFSILTPRSSLSKDLILELISVREKNKCTVIIDFRKTTSMLKGWISGLFFFGPKLTQLIIFISSNRDNRSSTVPVLKFYICIGLFSKEAEAFSCQVKVLMCLCSGKILRHFWSLCHDWETKNKVIWRKSTEVIFCLHRKFH